MAQIVEISLKVPSLRVRREGRDAPETISNSDIRFSKRIELAAIPKTGEMLTMDIGGSIPFQCEVTRSDWHNDKNLFVIACRYAKRSIAPEAYQALVDATDWELRPLI